MRRSVRKRLRVHCKIVRLKGVEYDRRPVFPNVSVWPRRCNITRGPYRHRIGTAGREDKRRDAYQVAGSSDLQA